MSPERLPDWLMPLWQKFDGRKAALPHAILLVGPEGSGKRLFAEHLARKLLCKSLREDGFACGVCVDCNWLNASTHPDYFLLTPAADELAGQPDEDSAESVKKEKAKSTQIVIDQVRGLQMALEGGADGHDGGRRVVVLNPAEAMNGAAANALLKSLEEPIGKTIYILLSSASRRLLPTIRSRCQVIDFPKPASEDAERWLLSEGVQNTALLGFSSGLPFSARSCAKGMLAELRQQTAEDLVNLRGREPLKLAAEWERRLKSKGAYEAGFDVDTLLSWILRWLSDGVRVSCGFHARYFKDYADRISQQTKSDLGAWQKAYSEISAHRRLSGHPLNQRLFLEELVMTLYRYVVAA